MCGFYVLERVEFSIVLTRSFINFDCLGAFRLRFALKKSVANKTVGLNALRITNNAYKRVANNERCV